MGSHTSSTLTFNISSPQGCVLSPLLYSLYPIVKFADDTAMISNNERVYLKEMDKPITMMLGKYPIPEIQ